MSNINIPNSVSFIDEDAFGYWPSTSTITVNNDESISNNWGTGWSGNAKVVYSN